MIILVSKGEQRLNIMHGTVAPFKCEYWCFIVGLIITKPNFLHNGLCIAMG